MPHRGRESEGSQRQDAAEAEYDFLLQAHVLTAAVQARRQFAVPRLVLLQVGVEQQQSHTPQAHFPHLHQHGSGAQRHGHHTRFAIVGLGLGDRGIGPIQPLVHFLLPAIGRDALAEVALRIHEAHPDKRDAQVACFLAVVACQHTKSAGVNRQ